MVCMYADIEAENAFGGRTQWSPLFQNRKMIFQVSINREQYVYVGNNVYFKHEVSIKYTLYYELQTKNDLRSFEGVYRSHT